MKIKNNKEGFWHAIKILAIVTLTIGGSLIYLFFNGTYFQDVAYENKAFIEVEAPLMTFEEKVNALKTEVRDKIMNGESAGIITEEGELFPTFDPHSAILEKCRKIGGKMNLDCLSFGPLQFKLSTIIRYEKDLNGRNITEMEALIIAHDVEMASKLFDDIVYGVEGGIWNWSVAYHNVSYYETVIPIIRKLIN